MKCHAHTVYACVFRVTAVSESVFPFSIKCQYREGITCPVSVFPILRSFIKTAGGVKTRCLGSGVKFKGRGEKVPPDCDIESDPAISCARPAFAPRAPYKAMEFAFGNCQTVWIWIWCCRNPSTSAGLHFWGNSLFQHFYGENMSQIFTPFLFTSKTDFSGGFSRFFSCWDSEVVRFLYADWSECTHLKALKRNCVGFSG